MQEKTNISFRKENHNQVFSETLHHALHRMKTRARSKTCYLDRLKEELEQYMDKKY
ncbi:RteC domain-containing protein [Myroides odoratimimus]|nr:RteC domain-containing protein [Myroides odoratimimus]MDX4973961.1 RteC domain-containing protein [Myroides odoratimimus]